MYQSVDSTSDLREHGVRVVTGFLCTGFIVCSRCARGLHISAACVVPLVHRGRLPGLQHLVH
jgi:hypothetical protein